MMDGQNKYLLLSALTFIACELYSNESVDPLIHVALGHRSRQVSEAYKLEDWEMAP